MKVLIVEDEILAAELLAKILRRSGYEVCEPAVSSEEAIAAAQEQRPDVVIMDIRLFGSSEDGLDTARRIRAFSRVPIVFTSGYVDEKSEAQAMALQPAAYLVKPIEIAALKRVMETLVREQGSGSGD